MSVISAGPTLIWCQTWQEYLRSTGRRGGGGGAISHYVLLLMVTASWSLRWTGHLDSKAVCLRYDLKSAHIEFGAYIEQMFRLWPKSCWRRFQPRLHELVDMFSKKTQTDFDRRFLCHPHHRHLSCHTLISWANTTSPVNQKETPKTHQHQSPPPPPPPPPRDWNRMEFETF